MRGLAAAADQTCAFALADLDVVEHTGALSRTDQRSHDLLRRMLIAELDVAEHRLQGFHPFGVTPLRQQESRLDRAALTGVPAEPGATPKRGRQLRVVAMVGCVLSASFPQEPLPGHSVAG